MLSNCGAVEDFWESLECKIKLVSPKGNQPWMFIGRTDPEAKAPIWPPSGKCQLIGKHPDTGKDWRQKEKGMAEDEMVKWNHRLNEHEYDPTPGGSEGQGSLVCYSPWGRKESDMTWQLNNNICCMNKRMEENINEWRNRQMYRSFSKPANFPFADQFSSVQWFRPVQLFATPWTAACQASLSIANQTSSENL